MPVTVVTPHRVTKRPSVEAAHDSIRSPTVTSAIPSSEHYRNIWTCESDGDAKTRSVVTESTVVVNIKYEYSKLCIVNSSDIDLNIHFLLFQVL